MLLIVETIGSAAAILCIAGLTALLVRRLASRKVFATTTFADVLVLLVLIAQAAAGLGVAVMHQVSAIPCREVVGRLPVMRFPQTILAP